MISGIIVNSATHWPTKVNGYAGNKSASVKFSLPNVKSGQDTVEISAKFDAKFDVTSELGTPIFAWTNVSIGVSASVWKSANYTDDNPVMLVKGVNVDGTHYETEVNINDVDPRNASYTEAAAIDGYLASKGMRPHVTRMQGIMALEGGAHGKIDADTKHDFLSALITHMETQKFHKNWASYLDMKPVVDYLLNHIAQKIDGTSTPNGAV